jgi:hypothetical protein
MVQGRDRQRGWTDTVKAMNITNIETVDLKNIGIIRGKLTDDVLDVLKKEIATLQTDFSKGTPWNSELAGNIKKEYLLTESNSILEPLVVGMAQAHQAKYDYADPLVDIVPGGRYKFALETAWVNFQQRYEFNPIHSHSGVYSFVIWLEIPYFLNFEQQVSPGKSSRFNRAGMFEFTYIDVLGNLRGESIPADKTYEGNIVMFPSKLHHMVHPFYSTDKYRISVAGNIKTIVE